ncbi:sporulation integral membrane protein YtvI [Anaerorhabdus sp.]|uniref:sporulation integral membrane protein YtvI n=1 Tax=Anaerorhabdus sp. TaxID=1872524 RepID=UPI002B212B0D|nr:sporulation integral membrane protein YtvI [Anaerorhabdus sp.]MEA4873984.1 sporulation integral membrane protein YtvI [Anaerorhabdus sp.]
MSLEKKKNFIINAFYYTIITILVFMIIKYGLNLLAPFLVAFIIAYLLRKPTKWMAKKIKLPYRAVSLIMVILFYSTIGVLCAFIAIKIGTSLANLVTSLPNFYKTELSPLLINFFDMIENSFKTLDPSLIKTISDVFNNFVQSIGELFSSLSVGAISVVSNYASTLPGLFIKILMAIISTFFIAIDYDLIVSFCKRQLSEKASNLIIHIKNYIVGTLFVCIRSYALIMTITFIELSIGLSLIRVENAILVALLIAFFDILPVLGTGGIMIPWMILVAFQGNFALAIGLLVVYLAITVIRNILEPKIVGAQLGLHPIVTLLAMFVGTQLFGFLGLFGLPITLSLLKHLNDDGTIKLFK